MTRLSRPRVHRESAAIAGAERGRTLSRRPPAITPLRVAGNSGTSTERELSVFMRPSSEPVSDLPRVVLRIPQLEPTETIIPFAEVLPKRSGKRHALLAMVAIVIAVLGFLLLRGERPAKQKEPVPPLIDVPGWKPAISPQQQPALSWQEAASTVPPTTAKLPVPQNSQSPMQDYVAEPNTSMPTGIVDLNAPAQEVIAPVFGERYSDHYRTADGRATLDRSPSGSSQPAVRFGSAGIGKIIPEIK